MTNVKLSTAEIELACNASIILTKNKIIEHIYQLFGNLSANYQSLLVNKSLPQQILSVPPKISKGENYEGLPWVMLDYPRKFTTQNIFAVRTFFWWGNFCTITLQLKGDFKKHFNYAKFKQNNNSWFVCCNDNEWQHNFSEENYLPATNFAEQQMNSLHFIKLAKKIPLQEWDNIEIFMKTSYVEILDFLTA